MVLSQTPEAIRRRNTIAIALLILLAALVIFTPMRQVFAENENAVSSSGGGDIFDTVGDALNSTLGKFVKLSSTLALCAFCGFGIMALISTDDRERQMWIKRMIKTIVIWIVIMLAGVIFNFVIDTFSFGETGTIDDINFVG